MPRNPKIPETPPIPEIPLISLQELEHEQRQRQKRREQASQAAAKNTSSLSPTSATLGERPQEEEATIAQLLRQVPERPADGVSAAAGAPQDSAFDVEAEALSEGADRGDAGAGDEVALEFQQHDVDDAAGKWLHGDGGEGEEDEAGRASGVANDGEDDDDDDIFLDARDELASVASRSSLLPEEEGGAAWGESPRQPSSLSRASLRGSSDTAPKKQVVSVGGGLGAGGIKVPTEPFRMGVWGSSRSVWIPHAI